MEQVTIKLDGKNKSFFLMGDIYSTPVNGYVVRRLIKGRKIFFASFDSNGIYLNGSFTPHGINHATDLLVFLNK